MGCVQAASMVTGAWTSRTIHVVDDDDSVRRALMRLLRAAGFDAHGYASAEQFLRAIKEASGGCVILDMHMPGTGGLELQRLMAHEHSAIPIIFVSGHGDERASAQA